MDAELVNKCFLVTGSASGMGLATAHLLARQGASLAVCDINRSGIEKIASELAEQYPGRPVISRAVDVTERGAVKAFLEDAKLQLGDIHGIANFAGTGGHQLGVESVWETTDEEFSFIIDINIRGLFNILGEALKSGVLPRLSSIVHVASMFGERGYRNGAVFASSKHAAVGMVKSAALEAGERNVRVNAVLPGAVDTPMFHQVRNNAGLSTSAENNPIRRPGQPYEIAHVTSFLLSDLSGYVTGSTWNVDGGANA